MRMYQVFCSVPDEEWAVHVAVKYRKVAGSFSRATFLPGMNK